MQRTFSIVLFLLVISFITPSQTAFATDKELIKQEGRILEVPGLVAIAGSETHLYALSSNDGLVVFRTYADSLQWLYSSEGIQRRGNRLQADIRFAYLTGNDNRLTVLEPTSVLGVYSSTTLPHKPGPMVRVEDLLYMGMSTNGLFRLSLATPASVDRVPIRVHDTYFANTRVQDIATSGRNLFVLDSSNAIQQFRIEGNQLEHTRTFSISEPLERIFIIDGAVIVVDWNGRIYELSGTGDLFRLFSVNGVAEQIIKQGSTYIIRTVDGRIYGGERSGSLRELRSDERASNFLAISKNTLWLSEYNQISPVRLINRVSDTNAVSGNRPVAPGSFKLEPIPNQIIPFSRTLLLPVSITGDVSAESVQLQIRSTASTSAAIRGQGFYWQPGSRDIGENAFTIIASSLSGKVDSTSFKVDVRSFNAPPRFNPVRPLSIPAGERFELPIRATDPDGSDPSLVRYLGVNLPDGASLDERTGLIRWTPHRRQIGIHEFQVIATDQYGSASSLSVNITVLELSRQ